VSVKGGRLLGGYFEVEMSQNAWSKPHSKMTDITIRTRLLTEVNNGIASECVLCKFRKVDFLVERDSRRILDIDRVKASCSSRDCFKDEKVEEFKVWSEDRLRKHNADFLIEPERPVTEVVYRSSVESAKKEGIEKDNAAYGSW